MMRIVGAVVFAGLTVALGRLTMGGAERTLCSGRVWY